MVTSTTKIAMEGAERQALPLSDIYSDLDIDTCTNSTSNTRVSVSSTSRSSSSSSGMSFTASYRRHRPRQEDGISVDTSISTSTSTSISQQKQQQQQQLHTHTHTHNSTGANKHLQQQKQQRRKIRILPSSSISQSSHFIKLKFVIILLSLFHLNTNIKSSKTQSYYHGQDGDGHSGSIGDAYGNYNGNTIVTSSTGVNIDLGMGMGMGMGELQILPLFGKVFVAGATTSVRTNRRNDDGTSSDEDDGDTEDGEHGLKRRQLHSHSHSRVHSNSNLHERGTKVFNVNAAPDVPIARRTKQNATNLLKSFNFRSKSQPPPPTAQVTFSEILKKAGKSGIGGGIPGAIAGIVQVLTLMWLRTVMNYQCRYGSTFLQSVRSLYNQGGIPRFYRGLSFALVQAPLARFVATAANDGVETLLANLKCTKDWGAGRSTVIASIVVGMWRIFLMPIDTCKTVLQVDSVDGFRSLMRKVKAGRIYVLYQGAAANAVSAIASHYPWFYTYRVLSHNRFLQNIIRSNTLRNALIGFISSVISDTVANSVRVVKTAKQAIASKHAVGYREVIAMILAVDGLKGLFGRGLRTRILGNALQSVLFTVIWRGLAERKHATREAQSKSEGRRSLMTHRRNEDEQDSGSASGASEGYVEEIEENDVPLEEERF
eukprot:CAMPEP_0203678240 /NCGR_PEP_ID=MMETSP0090-20130426/31205_1 /ASSEMBLY_ACC=CAM_ASM_001088 /TAXON_ID=426623 /ORGANISM="Chaetoceros affinis, Strain CCMP159" /LENGTH=656 /DNA_ID=CAMNT_0050545393 /DNA_START=284 /DNA_END=2254 /DNA_ORIENTATION=+